MGDKSLLLLLLLQRVKKEEKTLLERGELAPGAGGGGGPWVGFWVSTSVWCMVYGVWVYWVGGERWRFLWYKSVVVVVVGVGVGVWVLACPAF